MSLSFIRRVIRVKKEDSAFVYFVLEASEELTSYSTLDYVTGDPFRDLELMVPREFNAEVTQVLKQLGSMITELSDGDSPAPCQ